jgi:hypothetical protein
MLVARLGSGKRPKPPKVVGLGPKLLISIKVDAGTRNQLDLLLNA